MSVRFRFKINLSYSFLLSVYNLPTPQHFLFVELIHLFLQNLLLHTLPLLRVSFFHRLICFFLRCPEPSLLVSTPTVIPLRLPRKGPVTDVFVIRSQVLAFLFDFAMLSFGFPSWFDVLLLALVRRVTSVALLASAASASATLLHHLVSEGGERSRERTDFLAHVGHFVVLAVLC